MTEQQAKNKLRELLVGELPHNVGEKVVYGTTRFEHPFVSMFDLGGNENTSLDHQGGLLDLTMQGFIQCDLASECVEVYEKIYEILNGYQAGDIQAVFISPVNSYFTSQGDGHTKRFTLEVSIKRD